MSRTHEASLTTALAALRSAAAELRSAVSAPEPAAVAVSAPEQAVSAPEQAAEAVTVPEAVTEAAPAVTEAPEAVTEAADPEEVVITDAVLEAIMSPAASPLPTPDAGSAPNFTSALTPEIIAHFNAAATEFMKTAAELHAAVTDYAKSVPTPTEVQELRAHADSKERALKRKLAQKLAYIPRNREFLPPPKDLKLVLEAGRAYEALQDFYQSHDPKNADNRMSKAYYEIQLQTHAPKQSEFERMIEDARKKDRPPTVYELLGDPARRFLDLQIVQTTQKLRVALTKTMYFGDKTRFKQMRYDMRTLEVQNDMALLEAEAAYEELQAINEKFFPEEKYMWSCRIYNQIRGELWNQAPASGSLLYEADQIRGMSKDANTPYPNYKY